MEGGKDRNRLYRTAELSEVTLARLLFKQTHIHTTSLWLLGGVREPATQYREP